MRAGHAIWVTLVMALAAGGCGSSAPPAEPEKSGTPAAATYLAGLHASDLSKLVREKGLGCRDPRQERDQQHWVCEAQSPLITYFVEYYGKAPGRLEYIRIVVTQSTQPRLDRITAFLEVFAGLRYQGAEAAKARTWIDANIDKGGKQMFGIAQYKLSGDISRLVLEIKAPGGDF